VRQFGEKKSLAISFALVYISTIEK